ncbi:hypothetical protein DY000_02046634 [Brassica cretica]|uniref:Uncharacterized protein n=1 Tax=Brassica cretica TaxID=69181 RepID=A0ABQ7F8I7_BRACR|nr:hypothetical protein DY000_02046634 [Brassica cretica]
MLLFLYELYWILVYTHTNTLFIFSNLCICVRVFRRGIVLGYEVRGELPIQSCKAVLEKVKFLDNPSKEELASCFADVVTQIAQDLTMSGDHRSRLTKLCLKVPLTVGLIFGGLQGALCVPSPYHKRFLLGKADTRRSGM